MPYAVAASTSAWDSAGSAAGASLILGPREAEQAEAQSAADKRALNLALVVEYAEADFYAEAVKRGKLDGELRAFAEQVSGQEDDHVAFIKSALGSSAATAGLESIDVIAWVAIVP